MKRSMTYFITKYFNLAVPAVNRALLGILVSVYLNMKRQPLEEKRDHAHFDTLHLA